MAYSSSFVDTINLKSTLNYEQQLSHISEEDSEMVDKSPVNNNLPENITKKINQMVAD